MHFGWKLFNGYLIGPKVDLSGANLENVSLKGVNLKGTKLDGSILDYVSSGGIKGDPESLPKGWSKINGYLVGPGAYLYRANLNGENLEGVNLTDAYCEGIKLEGAILTDANLTRTNLFGAKIETPKLFSVSYLKTTEC